MSAVISPCGRYRYVLYRTVAAGTQRACIVMVNPSTADAENDDATIRKLIGFGKRLGWGSFAVVNKFAWRATDVNELRTASDPIGPFNDAYILSAMLTADIMIVAWGSLGKLPPALQKRYLSIVALASAAGKQLHCFGVCQDGHPRHPVMIGYDSPLVLW